MSPIENKLSPRDHAIVLIGRATPFVALALMWWALAREGIDLPFLDDWRDYAASTTGTYSLGYLFQPANDTLYPVGKLLDSIFLDAFDGNTLIYQLISMPVVLGAILLLTWKLLSATIDDQVLAACAFVTTLFMLQGDSYWGRQYLAYHQTIPLICLLGVLCTVFISKWPPAWRMATIFVLGLIAGGSYISGAFAGLTIALVLLAVGLVRSHRQDVLHAGLALGAASTIGMIAQAYVIVIVQHGQSHARAPWASPLSLDFWLYVLGKIGRSLALPLQYPNAALIAALGVALVSGAMVAGMIWRLSSSRPLGRQAEDRLTVSLSLAATIGVYLLLIAAARTAMRPGSVNTPIDVFQIGFARFHYFWVTLIWPWLFASLLVGLSGRLGRPATRLAGVTMTLLFAIGVIASGALDYRRAFAESAAVKIAGVKCIQDGLLTAAEIICPDLLPVGLNRAYANAVLAGASFAYAVPPTLRLYNSLPRQLLLDPGQFGPEKVAIQDATESSWTDNQLTLSANSGAKIEIKIGRPKRMGACRMLNLTTTLAGQPGQSARLFYRRLGETDFQPAPSPPVTSDGVHPTRFTISSPSGFSDTLRLDPIEGTGKVTVSDLSVHCLLP